MYCFKGFEVIAEFSVTGQYMVTSIANSEDSNARPNACTGHIGSNNQCSNYSARTPGWNCSVSVVTSVEEAVVSNLVTSICPKQEPNTLTLEEKIVFCR
ncbi:hypothetical protein N7495_000574 [Penicillium taxi]|uniref:uncharacterized protein n=1 Tax=Penicillium taxi TaxID=168475 RepID=UPI0025457346|nr:uncharacterized protein N7495_000574 [Penicillium taxi]KAJ5907892.1 hypothetical protein N7495_000574 [Penicillium taxi]